jgi:hypothetical protein
MINSNLNKPSTTRERKTRAKKNVAQKNLEQEETKAAQKVELEIQEKNKISDSSTFEKTLRKQLEIIDDKLSAAELIQQFNERLDNINTLSLNTTSSSSDTTADKILKKNNFLAGLFRSNSSNSSMRMIFFVWAIGTWVIWAGMSLYKNDLQPISAELAAVLAALGAAKMGQTFGENKFRNNSFSEDSE